MVRVNKPFRHDLKTGSEAARCPLCGGPNDCAPAACGRFDVECWCAHGRMPPEVLERIPEAQRGCACVCAACVGFRALRDQE